MENSKTQIVIAGILPLLTVPEVAVLIGESENQVRKLARLGKLPGARKYGRDWKFRRNEMQRHIEGK